MVKCDCWTVLNLQVVLLSRLSYCRRNESFHSVPLQLNHHEGKLKGSDIHFQMQSTYIKHRCKRIFCKKTIFHALLLKLSSRQDAFESDIQMLVQSGCGFVPPFAQLAISERGRCGLCYMLLFFVVCWVSEKLHSGLILKLKWKNNHIDLDVK